MKKSMTYKICTLVIGLTAILFTSCLSDGLTHVRVAWNLPVPYVVVMVPHASERPSFQEMLSSLMSVHPEKVDKKLISCKMVFCLVGDKVPCKDSKWSKIVPIWSKKTKEVFMLLFSCLYSL